MASLGTLAAELRLDGASAMMAGLRGAAGAVLGLGDALGGVGGPLGRLGGALQVLRGAGAGTRAAVAPFEAAGEAIRQLPGHAGRATAALQTLGRAGSGMLGSLARAGNIPVLGRALRLPGGAPSILLGSSGRGRERHSAVPQFRLPQRSPAQLRAGGAPALPTGGGAAAGAARAPNSARGLAALLAPLRRLAAGTAAAGAPSALRLPSARASAAGAGAGRAGEGDRLARVGGFIGGSGGPALDYHRRTAAATEKAAQNLQTLVQRWAGPDAAASRPAIWA